jgi:hypothetical protein
MNSYTFAGMMYAIGLILFLITGVVSPIVKRKLIKCIRNNKCNEKDA